MKGERGKGEGEGIFTYTYIYSDNTTKLYIQFAIRTVEGGERVATSLDAFERVEMV